MQDQYLLDDRYDGRNDIYYEILIDAHCDDSVKSAIMHEIITSTILDSGDAIEILDSDCVMIEELEHFDEIRIDSLNDKS